jgi:hypothetical protein
MRAQARSTWLALPLMSPSQSTRMTQHRQAAINYRYRLYNTHGRNEGETDCNTPVKRGEILWVGQGQKFRVLDVLPMLQEEPTDYAGLLVTERV